MAKRSKGEEFLLTLGAVMGLICILAAVSVALFGLTPLVFRSGSMAPAIATGSLALGREMPATEVEPGDIVSVERPDGSRITHRVASVDETAGNSATLTLKGDANSDVDPDSYVVTSVTDVIASVPYFGYFVAWLSTPFAWAAGAALSGWLIWAACRRQTDAPAKVHGHHRKPRRGMASASNSLAPLVLVVAAAGIVGIGFSRTEGTLAFASDTAQATASVTATTLLPPASLRCDDRTLSTVRLTFPRRTLPGVTLGYQISVGGMTPVALPTTTTDPVVYDLNRSLLGGLLTSGTKTVEIRTTFGTWVSPTAVTQSVNYPAVTGLNCTTSGSVVTSSSTAPRAARIANPETATSVAPTSSTTPTTAAEPTSTASTTATSSTTSPTTPASSSPPSPAPTTTTAPPPPPVTTSTTPPPPPASAFVADGGSATSGTTTASVSGSTLTLSGPDGTSFYSRAVSSSARYGTGVVFSNTGDLYVLSDAGVSRIVVANGVATESAVSTAELPSDISALL